MYRDPNNPDQFKAKRLPVEPYFSAQNTDVPHEHEVDGRVVELRPSVIEAQVEIGPLASRELAALSDEVEEMRDEYLDREAA